MIKFFRTIRKDLMEKNKTGKYFKYAIGEIILVVIGILIALQINNWNERKNDKNQLEHIYSIIAVDIKTDLVNITEVMKFYEELESLLMDIITTEYPETYFEGINKENYAESIHSKSRISVFIPYFTQEKGIELLNRFIDNNSTMVEDLSQEISQFYATDVKIMNGNRELVLSNTLDNFKYLEQYPWFKDYIIKRYNPETVRFFANECLIMVEE